MTGAREAGKPEIVQRQGESLRRAAELLGISHPTLYAAFKSGRVQRNEDGTYDVEACRIALAANSNPAKVRAGNAAKDRPASSGASPEEESLAEAARQLEWEKLRALQQKTDREAGMLADVSAVNAFVAGMIMKARDELIRIGSEIADELGQTSDPVKCRALVDDRIIQALANLKEYRPAA